MPNENDEETIRNTALASAYREIGELEDSALCRAICEATLQIHGIFAHRPWEELSEEEKKNPCIVAFKEERVRPSRLWAYEDLARIFLGQIDDLCRDRTDVKDPVMLDGSPISQDEDFISLADFMRINTPEPRVRSIPSYLFHEPDIQQITWWYFHVNEECFDEALHLVCIRVNHGVPLFESRDGVHVRLPFAHEDCIYLAKKVEHQETRMAASEAPGAYPAWAKRYFFKWEHLRVHDDYFGHRRGHSDSATGILREAFRRQIEVEADATVEHVKASRLVATDQPTRRYKTRLLDVADDIMNGQRADFGKLGGSEDGWPLKDNVIPWLRETFHLSEVEAKAVDMITRPDERRARGKRTLPRE